MRHSADVADGHGDGQASKLLDAQLAEQDCRGSVASELAMPPSVLESEAGEGEGGATPPAGGSAPCPGAGPPGGSLAGGPISRLRWPHCPSGAPDDPRANGEYALLGALASELVRVIDVGANVGDWTAEVLRVAPRCEVVAVEPQRALAERLRGRFAGRRVTGVCVAFGEGGGVGAERRGMLWGYRGLGSGMCGLIRRRGLGVAEAREEVWVLSLDRWLGWWGWREVDLVKVDTEGSEAAVLRGAEDLLRSRAVRFWQLEYGGCWRDAGERLSESVGLLVRAGYRVGTITPVGVVDDVGVDDYEYRNLFAWRLP